MNTVTTEGLVQASNVLIVVFSQIGGVGLGLMVPVLSAYVAAGIADRPGISLGLICGRLAVNMGSGFTGIKNAITDAGLQGATAVVLTTDISIKNDKRFAALPKVKVKADVVIKSADAIVAKIKQQLG